MILRLDGACKRYRPAGGERVALDEVSLDLDGGKMIGVFGESGAGKTTLLRVAAGMEKPDIGVVSYNGERLDAMSASNRSELRRREIACVWGSRSASDRMQVLEHVMLPLLVDHQPRRRAERLARDALLTCTADACNDLELEELSDGQRQRVEIARALVIAPRLLLADSPASHLPTIEREAVMKLLRDVAKRGAAVLVTSGDAETLMLCSRILYMREGRLSAGESQPQSATVHQLIRTPEPAAGAQARSCV